MRAFTSTPTCRPAGAIHIANDGETRFARSPIGSNEEPVQVKSAGVAAETTLHQRIPHTVTTRVVSLTWDLSHMFGTSDEHT